MWVKRNVRRNWLADGNELATYPGSGKDSEVGRKRSGTHGTGKRAVQVENGWRDLEAVRVRGRELSR